MLNGAKISATWTHKVEKDGAVETLGIENTGACAVNLFCPLFRYVTREKYFESLFPLHKIKGDIYNTFYWIIKPHMSYIWTRHRTSLEVGVDEITLAAVGYLVESKEP